MHWLSITNILIIIMIIIFTIIKIIIITIIIIIIFTTIAIIIFTVIINCLPPEEAFSALLKCSYS